MDVDDEPDALDLLEQQPGRTGPKTSSGSAAGAMTDDSGPALAKFPPADAKRDSAVAGTSSARPDAMRAVQTVVERDLAAMEDDGKMARRFASKTRRDRLMCHFYFELAPELRKTSLESKPLVLTADVADGAELVTAWAVAAHHFRLGSSAGDIRTFEAIVTERYIKPTVGDLQEMISRYIADSPDADLTKDHFRLQVSAALPPVKPIAIGPPLKPIAIGPHLKPVATGPPLKPVAIGSPVIAIGSPPKPVKPVAIAPASLSRPVTARSAPADSPSAGPSGRLDGKHAGAHADPLLGRATFGHAAGAMSSSTSRGGGTLTGDAMESREGGVKVLQLLQAQGLAGGSQTVDAYAQLLTQTRDLEMLGQTLSADLQAWFLLTRANLIKAQELVQQTALRFDDLAAKVDNAL
jgi:hypothetical protein